MKRMLVAAVPVLLVAACGGGSAESRLPATVTVVTTVSRTVTPPLTSPPTTLPGTPTSTDPNVGDRALKVGETRHGTAVEETVLEVQDPYPPNSYATPGPGKRWYGFRVKECQTAASADPIPVAWGDWAVVDSTDAVYKAGIAWDESFPSPQFPSNGYLTLHECLQGWVLVDLPSSVQPTAVVFQPGGQRLAEWVR